MAEPTPDSDVDALDDEGEADPHASLHTEALERFDQIVQAVQEERALALRDRRFATIPGAQWEGLWGEQFEHSIVVEVNKTAQACEKIIADQRASRVIVDFRCADDDADEDTAELLNGMFRADLYASSGMQAIDMACEEAVQGGIGAWRLANDWTDEYDPDDDTQRICFVGIPDADQRVFWDPNAKLYNKRDAKYAFVITAIANEAYEEKYGHNPADWPTGLFKTFYEWYTPAVSYIAEYYEVREKEGKLYVLENKATGDEKRVWAADLDDGELEDLKQQGWDHVRTRQGKRRQVWKTVLSGAGVLEAPKQIAGQWIPIIMVYGKRWFIDNMERAKGTVRDFVDRQRVLNAQISKLVETAAASPIERPIVTPEQIAGHEQSWSRANIERHAYALLNPMVDANGNSLPAAPIGKVEPPQLAPAVVALLQFTANDFAELNADGADEAKANISAEAMDLAATRTDAKSEIYMDNRRQSMEWCGVVYQSMAQDVYVEAGRKVPVTDANDQHSHKTLLEAYADEKGFRIRHDITKGKYNVVASVTEATTTRRDKTVRTLVNMAQMAAPVAPQLSGVALLTALMNMDGEGMHDLKDWSRAQLVQQGVVKPNDEEKQQMAQAAQAQGQQPPSAQDQLTAAKVATEQTTAALNQAKTILTMKQAEGEGAKTVGAISLAKLEAVHAEQDQQADHAQRGQEMAHAAQAHALDMAQGVQGMQHAQQAHKVGIIEKVRNMFAPKPQAGA